MDSSFTHRPFSFARFASTATTALLLLAICCAGLEVFAQERAPAAHVPASWTKDGVDLAKLFAAVVDTVDKKFFDTAVLKKLDWRGRADAVRGSVVAAPTIEDAVGQINALLAELK